MSNLDSIKIEFIPPPNIKALVAAFGINPLTTLFAYGKKIYNPGMLLIPKALLVHESIHIRQQGEVPDLWWGKYLREPAFRAEQEAEAYAHELHEWNRNHKYELRRAEYEMRCATILASKLYGNCIGYGEAIALIRKFYNQIP